MTATPMPDEHSVMTDGFITWPNCDTEFPLTKILAKGLLAPFRAATEAQARTGGEISAAIGAPNRRIEILMGPAREGRVSKLRYRRSHSWRNLCWRKPVFGKRSMLTRERVRVCVAFQ